MSRLILLFTSVIVATIFTINAFWLQLKGHSTIEIINHLPILFAPANYTYYIWLVVFIFLFLWIYSYLKVRRSDISFSNLQTILFLFVIIFQCVSLWSFHSDKLIETIAILFLQVLTLFGLYLTYPLKNEWFKLRLPIAIYFSWSTFFLILILCYFLVRIEWDGFGLSNALWAVIIMTFGAAIALHVRYHHFDIAFPFVFIWCYIGIVISNGFDELLVSTAALFLIGVMIVGILFIRKSSINTK